MGNVRTPPTPPSTPLFWVAWYLRGVGDYFKAVADSVQGVFLLGDYLYSPFYQIGSYFVTMSGYANSADNYLIYLRQWVDGIVNGNTFIDLLRWASSNFDAIMQNGREWVRAKIAEFGYDFALFVASPVEFFKRQFRNAVWWGDAFLSNPNRFVTEAIRQFSGEIDALLANPQNWVRNYLRSSYWWLPQFLDNPAFYIQGAVRLISPDVSLLLTNPGQYVVNKIRSISPDVNQLLTNPAGYVQSRVKQLIGLPDQFYANPVNYLVTAGLSLLLTSLDSFGEQLKALVIAFILKYM